MSNETKRGRRGTPSISPSDLKSAVSPAGVERVWRRLDESLDRSVSGAFPDRASVSLRRRPHLWVGGAVAALTFGSGIWVGRLSAPSPPQLEARVSAEPNRASAGQTAQVRPRPTTEHTVTVVPPSLVPPGPPGPEPKRRSRGTAVPAPLADEAIAPEIPSTDVLAPPEPLAIDSASDLEPNVSPEPPPWQRLANGGEYEAALFEISRNGGFESALGDSSSEQLMLLVDVARATGQRQRAIAALRRVVAEYPSDPVAPLAAWSLGDLLEQSGDQQGAVNAFAAYRVLSPRGDFAEDALVRELRTAVQRRAQDEAIALAAQYERDFPEGGRSDEVARWLALLESSSSADSDAGAPADMSEFDSDEQAEDDGESEQQPR